MVLPVRALAVEDDDGARRPRAADAEDLTHVMLGAYRGTIDDAVEGSEEA